MKISSAVFLFRFLECEHRSVLKRRNVSIKNTLITSFKGIRKITSIQRTAEHHETERKPKTHLNDSDIPCFPQGGDLQSCNIRTRRVNIVSRSQIHRKSWR